MMKTKLFRFQFVLALTFIAMFTGLNAQNCLSGYSYIGSYGGHFYYLSNANVHPSQAYPLAEATGGYLASITSAGENIWLSTHVPGYITIGFNDVNSEGDFEWHSGEAVTYSKWWPGEPNDLGGEDYTVINFGGIGYWNDVPDWTSQRYIVEIGDDDCDGVGNACDICPGGDDSVDNNGDGIADCSQLLDYADYSSDWYCGANKIIVCHNGDNNPHSICINKNALPAHFNHGDHIGPCTSCGGSLRKTNDKLSNVSGMELDVYPNQEGNVLDVHVQGLETAVALYIHDQLGRMVWSSQISPDQIESKIYLDHSLKGGIYFASITSNGEVVTKRFVIVR